MASIKQYAAKSGPKGKLWRVQYRDAQSKGRTKSGFRTKSEAELWASKNTVDLATDEWIDPKLKKIRVHELGAQWLATRTHLKESTRNLVRIDWETHVEPEWGDRLVVSIRPSQVQEWVSNLGRSASRVRSVHLCLAQILDIAVKDGILKANPARGVTLPRKTKGVKVYLTIEELKLLADSSNRHPELIWLLGTSGLRWGEAAALRPMDLDPLRNRISITRAAMNVGSRIKIAETKTYETRTVAVAETVMKMLVELCHGKERDGLLWPRADGGLMRPPGHGSFFAYAVVRAQEARRVEIEEAKKNHQPVPAPFPRLTPHGLRHVAAGLLVQSGANVKAVQRQLGHANASMTLDTYAELWDDGLDVIAGVLDEMVGKVRQVSQVS